jgi:hypothetical protein
MKQDGDSAAFRQFLSRVWLEDVAPLLRDHPRARGVAARMGGLAGAAAGLLLDSALGLRGRPFARGLTILGATGGALLPDAWTRRPRSERGKDVERVGPPPRVRLQRDAWEREALALFGLLPTATREQLRSAWHRVSLQWHPDRAASAAARMEHHVRFLLYRATYERLVQAYEGGRLPLSS